MNKRSKQEAKLANQLRATKSAKDADNAGLESEMQRLENLASHADERGDAPELPAMSVKDRKLLRNPDDATRKARREDIAKWKADVATAQSKATGKNKA